MNTCPRARPGAPCHRTEYVDLHQDRFASQADEDDFARRTASVIEPRRPQTTALRKKRRPASLLDNFSIDFKLWNPFSSKKKKKRKESREIERTRGPDSRIGMIERLPRAPSPPPAWTPHEQQPFIVAASPRRGRSQSPGPRERPRRRRRRSPVQVVIHQSSESSKEDTPSPPDFVREHTRPQRPRSSSPIGAEETMRREKEKRERAERVAQAERQARERAERRASAERRYNDDLRQRVNAQRRLSHEDRPRLETAEGARWRMQREADERAEVARRRQESLDLEAYRQAHQPGQISRGGIIPPRPLAQHPVTVHNHFGNLEDRGSAFLNSAYEGALRAEHRNVGTSRGEGLRRRGTVDGGGRKLHEGERRRHERRPGGSG